MIPMNERRKLTMADYIPEVDANFRVWADNFMSCVSDHPEDESEMRYIGLVTGGRTVIEYPCEDAGRKAHYRLRWVNMKGEKSAWSALHSAMIVG
jgi:hypothetical protein